MMYHDIYWNLIIIEKNCQLWWGFYVYDISIQFNSLSQLIPSVFYSIMEWDK